MLIDTSDLTALITEMRRQTGAHSVSPETIGYLLQRITNLLATAGTSETVEKIQKLLDGFKAAGSAITSIEPLSTDRNNILANVSTLNLANGTVSTQQVELIHQATTEHAGAMRAQQVTDLNAARNNVATLQKQMTAVLETLEQLQNEIGNGGSGTVVTTAPNLGKISCEIVDGELVLRGFSKYLKAGYIPYLFRMTRKRNRFKLEHCPEDKKGKKYSEPTKGWHLYGSCYSVKMEFDRVIFSSNVHTKLSCPAETYSCRPDSIMKVHINKAGFECVPWGRSIVKLIDRNGKYRMLRFRFGIGFGKRLLPNVVKITPANLVSNLAEFTIVYDSITKKFEFSRPGQ